MHPKRKRRLYTLVFVLLGLGGTTAVLMSALEQNINMFYPPAEVVSGQAPQATTIRAGGMVLEDSVARAADSLRVQFVITDRNGSEFPVVYEGILPDLFREGQGIIVKGELNNGQFVAAEVLAKHDENYMPPELMDMAEHVKQKQKPSAYAEPGG